VSFLATHHEEIRQGAYDVERMQLLVREGFADMLHCCMSPADYPGTQSDQ
jgi:hypothetical protein